MCTPAWNKAFVISLALAVGGMLACVGALLDLLLPHGSTLAALCKLGLLGLAVGGTLIGFTWACDRCNSHCRESRDQWLAAAEQARVVKARPIVPWTWSNFDRRSASAFPPPSSSGRQYVGPLRGSAWPKSSPPPTASSTRVWHGQ